MREDWHECINNHILYDFTGAVGNEEEGSTEDKDAADEEEQERLEALREAEERRKEKHRKMEEEREKMRQEIRDKVIRYFFFQNSNNMQCNHYK